MTKSTTGTLYLIPNTLGGESIQQIIPQDVVSLAIELRHFAVEDIKSARRLLRKFDRNFPIDESTFFHISKKKKQDNIPSILNKLRAGNSVGIISDAGCAGIADPGAELVAAAHEEELRIEPLVGPSSILLALIASGFNGQDFAFHGYLPKDRKDRINKMKDFEGDTRRNNRTHIFMDTPFRNMNVLEDLLNELGDNTMLCIAHNLTCHNGSTRTYSVKDWREKAYDLEKNPTIFIIGNSQHF